MCPEALVLDLTLRINWGHNDLEVPQINGVGSAAEVLEVGEHQGQFGGAHAKPLGQGRGILVDRRAGQQTALANVPLILGG